MSSRSDRFSANTAIFFSTAFCCCCCCLPTPQFLDVRVRANGAGSARVDNVLITVTPTAGGAAVQRVTDDLGDAIFRLPVGNYDVRARKAWFSPDDQTIANQALAQRSSTIVRFNKQPLFFYLHVDGNRDGNVDNQPEAPRNTIAPAWAWGVGQRGAIIFCNNDNDGMPNAGDPDNTDPTINAGNDATHEMAHLEIRRHGNVNPPAAWTATLDIMSPAGQANPENYVRVFNGDAANDAQLLGPGTPQAAVNNFANNPRTLGMEAINYAGTNFNGVVCVRLTITSPDPMGGANLTYFTEAQLRVAPWLMPTHMDRPQRVYVTDAGNSNNAFRIGLAADVLLAVDGAGTAPALTEHADPLVLSELRDIWMQDCMEIGYSNFPGNGNGAVRIDSYMKAQRNQGAFDLKDFPTEQLGVQIGHSYPAQPVYDLALAVPGMGGLSPAEQAASNQLQALGVGAGDADNIAQAAGAQQVAGNNEDAVVAAATSTAAAVAGVPTVAANISSAAGIAATQASITAYNGGAAAPGAVYAAALAAVGGGGAGAANVAAAQAASYASEAIIAANLNVGGVGHAIAGQNAAIAVAVAIGGGAAAPATAGADAVAMIVALHESELRNAMFTAYSVAKASGITRPQAQDATTMGIVAQYFLIADAVPNNTFNSTGNLEVTPPVRALAGAVGGAGPKDYRWGRIYYGRGRPGSNFDPDTLAFLTGQSVQAPIALNTDWLIVGHVDEMMTFVPTPDNARPWNKQWRLLIASPRAAYAIIGVAPGVSVVMNGRNLSFGNAQTTATNMMNAAGLASPIPNPSGGFLTWQELREWNLGALQDVIDAVVQSLVDEIDLDIANDVIEVPVVFMPEDILAGPAALGDLHNPLQPANGGLNVHPGRPGGFTCGALTADMVNMLVLNNHLIIPKPFGPENPVGTDLFEANLTASLNGVNNQLQPQYLDDWDAYHANLGEVHCGTNTLRQPANIAHWLANDAKARWWEFPG